MFDPTFVHVKWTRITHVRLRRSFDTNIIIQGVFVTYNSLVVVGPTRVSGSHRGSTFLGIPGCELLLGGTADRYSIDTSGITVTVTIVLQMTAISGSPCVDHTLTSSTLLKWQGNSVF